MPPKADENMGSAGGASTRTGATDESAGAGGVPGAIGVNRDVAGDGDLSEGTATNEFNGRVISADLPDFKIEKDYNGTTAKVERKVVAEAVGGGDGSNFEYDTPVTFTTLPDNTTVLSLRKRAGNEASTATGAADAGETVAKEAEKSA